jgi:hypothetical protein
VGLLDGINQPYHHAIGHALIPPLLHRVRESR